MRCMECGATLTEQDYCVKCGADVKIYKKLVRISNSYYNAGLAKANVRDLSGAIRDLKYSLEVNKYNIPARNLLGLIYFEIGEVVDALTEWIISKNLQPKKNVADEYIRAIQANPARLETINQTIKKYNQSLLYCKQGSEDLAIIQLKKVLSLNPKLVKAHRLLALLYIKTENYERAGRELKRALAIDRTDTLSLRYQKELEQGTEKDKDPGKKEEKNQDVISYTSGNETIIMPAAYKDTSKSNVVVNIIIGLVVGVALMWFLVVPAKIKSARSEANQQIVEFNAQLSAKEAVVDSLTQELEAAQQALAELEANPGASQEAQAAMDKLTEAAAAYNSKKNDEAKTLLGEVDEGQLSDAAKALYFQLDITLNPADYKAAYDAGVDAYELKKHAEVITHLEPIVQADPSYENGYALYYLARSCEGAGETQKAIQYYTQFTELFPNTERANYSATALQRLQGTTGTGTADTAQGTTQPDAQTPVATQ